MGFLTLIITPGDSKGFGIDIFHVNILWKIIEQTDSKIITPSSWRYGGIGSGSDLYILFLLAAQLGLEYILRIIGQTRSLADKQLNKNLSLRESEIIDYIDENDFQGNSLVLDDIEMYKLNNRQILTDHKFELLESDIEKQLKS